MSQIQLPVQLDRDIIFFDLEATGDNPYTDRIVEISVIKFKTDGTKIKKTRRINPQMPISPGASAIHHITDEDVKDEPTFEQLAPGIFKFFEGCDLAGYNIIRFDIPMLIEEFKRAKIDNFSLKDRRIIDSYEIFIQMEPRTLSAALKFYCNKDFQNAHTAEADVEATIEVFVGQLRRYPQLPKTIPDLSAMFKSEKLIDFENKVDSDGKFIWRNGEVVVNFGKYKGIPLKKVAAEKPDFLSWIVNKSSFSEEIKQISKNALEGKFPEKQQ